MKDFLYESNKKASAASGGKTGAAPTFEDDTIDLTDQGKSTSTELTLSSSLPVRHQGAPKKAYGSGLTRAGATDVSVGGYGGEFGLGADGKGRMGDRMIALGMITAEQLNVALQEKRISGKMLGQVLVELGFITEQSLTAFLAETAGFEVFDPKATIFDGDALALVSKEEAKKLRILPISYSDQTAVVAIVDPYDVVALDSLRRILPKGTTIRFMVTTAAVLAEAIDAAYGYSSAIADILKELEGDKGQQDMTKVSENEAFTHPIVRLVNAFMSEAVKMGVSDLHFEPEENFVRLRYRLDGVLFTAQIIHKNLWNGISQRIKILSNMNIADKLSPQDGRFNLNIGDREADFRVSSSPRLEFATTMTSKPSSGL